MLFFSERDEERLVAARWLFVLLCFTTGKQTDRVLEKKKNKIKYQSILFSFTKQGFIKLPKHKTLISQNQNLGTNRLNTRH